MVFVTATWHFTSLTDSLTNGHNLVVYTSGGMGGGGGGNVGRFVSMKKGPKKIDPCVLQNSDKWLIYLI